MRSFLKATYNVLDQNDQQKFTVTEDNAWGEIFRWNGE